MAMDHRQFEKNTFLYGSDLHQWPEEIRKAGLESLQNSWELQVFLEEQEQFERVLRARKYEEPSGDFLQRVGLLSLRRENKSTSGFSFFLHRLLFEEEFHWPKPAFIVVSILMIVILGMGFFIGFSTSKNSMLNNANQINLQEFLHYEERSLL